MSLSSISLSADESEVPNVSSDLIKRPPTATFQLGDSRDSLLLDASRNIESQTKETLLSDIKTNERGALVYLVDMNCILPVDRRIPTL
jgi:hypothetical protein